MKQSGIWIIGCGLQGLNPFVWIALALLVLNAIILAKRLPHMSRVLKNCFFVVGIIAIVAYAAFVPWFDNDEADHLHSSWLMAQGLLPFRDFWEHHSPALWCLVSPVLRVVPAGVYLCDLARVATTLIAAACLPFLLYWSRRLTDDKISSRWTIWLWAGALVPGELYLLRPDVPANLLCLASLVLLLDTMRPIRYFFAALLLGLAVSFTPKCGVFIPILFLSFLLDWREREQLPLKFAACVGGGVAGLLPLYLWLTAHGLVGDYIHWVWQFNSSGRGLSLGGTVPLACLLPAAVWIWSLRGKQWQRRDRLITLAALGAALCVFGAQPDANRFVYNLQMLLLLVAAIAPSAIVALQREAPRRISRVLTTTIAVLPLLSLVTVLQAGFYTTGRQQVKQLQQLAGNEAVLGRGSCHPIFAHDAVDLSLAWHWEWLSNPELRTHLDDLADRLLAARPPVLYASGATRSSLCGTLLLADAINANDAVRLQTMLTRHYHFVQLSAGPFCWVRKDRIVLPSEVSIDCKDISAAYMER